MADHLLRDRQDVPIFNAIEANNLKQALKLVDKRLAKKHTDYLEALKIYIRSKSTALVERSAVLTHLEGLNLRKPPLTDQDAIELYEESLGNVLPDDKETWAKIIGELRWQGVKTSPKNEELCLNSLQKCLSNDDLDHARQISNTLEKAFPEKHEYIFWNISAMFLFAISKKCPESQKKIWGGLALGQIAKLATATKQNSDPKNLPNRSIHTPQELLLLHRITAEYGKTEQRREYLSDPQLGPESKIAKGEWQLWRFKLKLMENARQWQELFETTSNLLERARTKNENGRIAEPGMNDWVVWEAFLRSAYELPGHRQKCIVLNEIEAHLDPNSGIDKSWRRNASLAWVEFCFSTATPFSVLPDTTGKGQILTHIPIVFKFLQKYGHATTAYNDLRPFIERLDSQERTQLLTLLLNCEIFETSNAPKIESSDIERSQGILKQDLSTANQITEIINTYKIRYLLVSALPEHERSGSPLYRPAVKQLHCVTCSKPCYLVCGNCIGSLARDSIGSYEQAMSDDGQIMRSLLPTDRHPADDFCILAALCLIKLSLMEAKDTSTSLTNARASYILQAILLLEYGWTRSKPNPQISILLVRLYTYLGCGSLAMRAYQRLALKQIQLDTLSYPIVDRISSQHPHAYSHIPDSSTQLRPPPYHLQQQQNLYKSAIDQVTKNIWTSFKQGNYNSIFEIKDVSDTLSHTLSAATSVIESRKISRLTDPGVPLTTLSGGYGILPPSPEHLDTAFVDTNDYASFPDFESSQGLRFEKLSRYAPGPSDYRYRLNLTADKLMQVVDPSADIASTETDLNWLREHVEFEKDKRSLPAPEALTRSEYLASRAYDEVLVILSQSCDKECWQQDGFETRLQESNERLQLTLRENTSLITDMKEVVPAFWNTLHVLYTAYEVARTVLHFGNYLTNRASKVYGEQGDAIKKAVEGAQLLVGAVVDKCSDIKKGHDEGGWIDKVLARTLPDEVSEEAAPASVVGPLRDLVDENFTEEWAGLVVESWRDSITGLSLLKPLKA